MKEYFQTTGGRHLYGTDFRNLQELALSMTELFRECGGNFVISGCVCRSYSTVSMTGTYPEGYVYIDGKIRHVEAKSGLSFNNLKIVAKERTSGNLLYDDGSYHPQYTEYYAEYENTDSVDTPYIALEDTRSMPPSFPNLFSFFRKYSVTKESMSTGGDSQTLYTGLDVNGRLSGVEVKSQGDLYVGGDNLKIRSDGEGITLEQKTGVSLRITNDHEVYYKYSEKDEWKLLASILPVNGLLPYFKQAQIDLLYVHDINRNGDGASSYAPVLIGSIQIWAGKEIPFHYCLCDGRELKMDDYKQLYETIGDMYNTAYDYRGKRYEAPNKGYFRIPDLRGRFIVGYDSDNIEYSQYGNAGGEKTHTLAESEMPQHKHDYASPTLKSAYVEDWNDDIFRHIHLEDESSAPGGNFTDDGGWFPRKGGDVMFPTLVGVETNSFHGIPTTQENTSNTGGGRPHENRPPFYTLAYIIRVK